MTVIVGVNLSDRVYLSGDSRLSYYEGDTIHTVHDNMQKVENIYGRRVITVASAGNASFASFILNKLLLDEISQLEIDRLREQLPGWLRSIANEYFTMHEYANAVFIFGGSTSASNKVILGKRIKELANAYTGGKGYIRLSPALAGVFKQYGNHLPDENITLDVPDTRLFSVQITRDGIEVTDTKWGEFLMYGPPGLTRQDVTPKDIASFEFNPTMLNNGSGVGNTLALLNAFIYSQAKAHDFGGVGGSVVIFENSCKGTYRILSGMTYMYDPGHLATLKDLQPIRASDAELINAIDAIDDEHIYRDLDGQRYRLIPVSHYVPNGSTLMVL